MNKVKLDTTKTAEIIARGKTVEQNFATLKENYMQYRRMYFMDWTKKPRNAEIDANDWRITPSPSARNEVIGIKRLLDTSEIQIKTTENNAASQNADKIERGLKQVVEVSGEGKRARILSDATLAVSLYGPCIIYAEFFQDKLQAGGLTPYAKRHIEKQARKSPAIIEVLNAEECSFEFDGGQLIHFQRRYQLRGSQIKNRWGELTSKPLKDNAEFWVRDIFTLEDRVIDVEGYGTVLAMPHKLGCIPVAIGFSGGSELFYKPEESINPFLYAKMKAGLWEGETATLTSIFTAVNMRGVLGPMYHIDGNPSSINIQYKGGARFLTTDGVGKVTPIDDRIIDPMAFKILELTDSLGGQSTVYKQTLGEGANNGTFSGLAMLSSAGKLPLVDPERALQQAFEGIFDYILYHIKTESVDNPILPPQDIPENYEIRVEFKPQLPQDDLRNATIAAQIQGLVSEEWIQQNVLQIGDSAAMRKQITKEAIYKAIVGRMVENPQFMDGMVSQVMGQQGQGQPPQPGQPGPQMPGQPAMPQPQQPQQPQQPDPMMMQQGQPGQPGMEATPQIDAMIPQQERS